MTPQIHFDFTCRFANRLHLWLRALDVPADWRPFCLLEAKRDDPGPPVWEREEHSDNISLLMLAGHELTRRSGGDTDHYRSDVFAAWHGSDQHLDADDILGYISRAGGDADEADLAAGRSMVAEHHVSAVEHGVFGSSTIVFPSGRGSFIRFGAVPSVDDGEHILDALRTLAERAPQLVHLEPLRG